MAFDIRKLSSKPLVFGSIAAAVGIVGYAWITRNGSSGEVTEDEGLIESGSGERIPPTTINSEGFFDNRTGIKTNDEWRDVAIEKLRDIGRDAGAVSTALGNFIAKRPLSKTDAGLVREAIAAAGYPPVGGPWVVNEDPTPAAVGLPAPSVTGGQVVHDGNVGIRWHWSPVAGATGYDTVLKEVATGEVIHNGTLGNADSQGNIKISVEPSPNTWTSYVGLDPGTLYELTVYARNSAGGRGDPGVARAKSALINS